MAQLRLTPEQVSVYQRDGFLVLDDVLSGEEIDAFLAHQETRPESLDLNLRSHVLDPQWRYLVSHPNVAGPAAQLLDGTPRIVQVRSGRRCSFRSSQDRLSWAVHYVKEGTWVLREDVQDTVAVAELACKANPSAPADAEKPHRGSK